MDLATLQQMQDALTLSFSNLANKSNEIVVQRLDMCLIGYQHFSPYYFIAKL